MVCLLALTACGGNKEDASGNVGSTEEAVSNISSTEDVVSNIFTSEDDKRYSAFFENEFTDMASDLWCSLYKPSFLFTYADLDNNGSNELIIGNDEGIYFVITEIDGKYNKSGSYGWMKQLGPMPSVHVGNGYFITYYSDSNGMYTELTHYEPEIKNMGIIAKYETGDDGWNLYVLSKDGTPNVFNINEYNGDYDEANYTHSFLDYDDAHDCDYCTLKYFDGYGGDCYGVMETNKLEREYTDLLASKESEDWLEDLTWRPVGEMVFKNSKMSMKKDISPDMARLLSDVTTALYIAINERFYDFDNERDEIIERAEWMAKDESLGFKGKISYDRVIAADGSSMPCDEFDELVIEALGKR